MRESEKEGEREGGRGGVYGNCILELQTSGKEFGPRLTSS